MSEKKYIFDSRLLSSLDENLIIENLNKFMFMNVSPSRIYISFCDFDETTFLSKDTVLIGKGFNFSNLDDKEVYFTFSRNDFIRASHLVFDIINRFRKKMEIYQPFSGNELLYEVARSYIDIGDTSFLCLDRDEYVLLKESPLSEQSSLKLSFIEQKNRVEEKKYLVYDIMDENIFIDREFFYFKKDDNFYKIKKYRVSLV